MKRYTMRIELERRFDKRDYPVVTIAPAELLIAGRWTGAKFILLWPPVENPEVARLP